MENSFFSPARHVLAAGNPNPMVQFFVVIQALLVKQIQMLLIRPSCPLLVNPSPTSTCRCALHFALILSYSWNLWNPSVFRSQDASQRCPLRRVRRALWTERLFDNLRVERH
jgi:hypothetical protein